MPSAEAWAPSPAVPTLASAGDLAAADAADTTSTNAKAARLGFGAWLGAKLGLGNAVPRSYVGRWALVTGASSGIGACFAEELARRGAHLLLTARSEDKLRALATRLKQDHACRAEVIVADLAVPGVARKLMQEIRARGQRVDVLVNNAGLGAYGRAEAIDPARQQAMLQVNVVATTELALACLPAMQAAKEGTILNVASIAAFTAMPYLGSYAATKAYILSFSEGLWAENRNQGVRVLAVCPGPTATGFFEGASMDHPESTMGSLASCQSVVDASFKAVDQDRSHVITNTADYIKIQSLRLMPRSFVVSTMEPLFRPDTESYSDDLRD